eukprot:6404172-Amphidinium_carterae.3
MRGLRLGIAISSNTCLMCCVSIVACHIAYSSASAELKAVVDCVLLMSSGTPARCDWSTCTLSCCIATGPVTVSTSLHVNFDLSLFSFWCKCHFVVPLMYLSNYLRFFKSLLSGWCSALDSSLTANAMSARNCESQSNCPTAVLYCECCSLSSGCAATGGILLPGVVVGLHLSIL